MSWRGAQGDWSHAPLAERWRAPILTYCPLSSSRGATRGAHLPATCLFWGHYFGEGGALGWQEPLLPQRGVWGIMAPHFSPNSSEGHSLSCHGFCSPILGLFILVSAKTKLPSCHGAILSAARGHAELETEGGLAHLLGPCAWVQKPQPAPSPVGSAKESIL